MSTRPLRVPRDDQNLLAALRRHLTLLKEYTNRAFAGNEDIFYGEVAGKLRVLVYTSRTNKPLLLSLMDQFGVQIPVTINKPSGEIQLTLDEYLGRLACAITTPSQGLVELSRQQLIGLWSQQYGAAHEDWALSEELASAFAHSIEFHISGLPAVAASLGAIARTVLWVGEEFLAKVDDESGTEVHTSASE